MRWVALGTLSAVLAWAGPAEGQPVVQARAFVLLEARTGQVLAQRNAHLSWPPASTTKILTAWLVAESLPAARVVTVSRRAAAQRSGSTLGLRAGEHRRVGDLLYAMLLASANDAAVALAEAAGGTVEDFVERMNRKARELGLRDTHFTNPHGLYDPRHRSSAYDLALLARAALQNRRVARAVATREYELESDSGVRKLQNRNRLLETYPGANGVKTGWIAESGPCLVASARRDGRTLIVVVLDSPEVFRDAARLLDYGFGAYELRVLALPQELLATRRLPTGQVVRATVREELLWAVPRGARADLQVRWESELRAPVQVGQEVGWVEVMVGGRPQSRFRLVAMESVGGEAGPKAFWQRIVELLGRK